MTNISCVLFDLGGVIINWDNLWLIQEISDTFQLQKEKVSKAFYKYLPDISIDKIGEKEFWHIIGKELESDKLMNYNKSILDEIFRRRVSLNDSIISLSQELSQKGIDIGLILDERKIIYKEKASKLQKSLKKMENSLISPSKASKFGINIAKDGVKRNAIEILSQKSVKMSKIREIWPEIKYVSREIDEQIEIKAHYKGYLKKQDADILAFKRDEKYSVLCERG